LENVGIFYGHLKYFMDILGYFVTIRYIFCSFGTFFQFWYRAPRKIWQPCDIWSVPLQWYNLKHWSRNAYLIL
jgi:hypothetical protein